MQHGCSRLACLADRRWVVAAVLLVAFLSLTGVSGPTSHQPLQSVQKPVSNPVARVSTKISATHTDLIFASTITPDSSRVPASGDLLFDLKTPPARPLSIAGDALTPVTKARSLWMEVTAYCPCKKCCGSYAKGITSSGRPITYNGGKFVAADLKMLPYGTKIIVPGYNDDKPVEVIDRGGAIRGNHIDIFMQTHEEAVEWGKKRVQVMVVE